MIFNPQNHQRRSIRLKGYDYSGAGAYFITLVSNQRECVFGEIKNGSMELSPTGQIAEDNWRAIPDHFPNVELGAHVVMPNHVHGIKIIQSIAEAAQRGATQFGATHCVAPTKPIVPTAGAEKPNGPKRGSIGAIIGAYKMSVTRRIQKELQDLNKLQPNIWQRNYYEHIIRNDEEHSRIHLYIEANLDNWATDDENPNKTT